MRRYRRTSGFSWVRTVTFAGAFCTGRLLYPQSVKWPDTRINRVEMLALMQTLNAELLASRSATQTLEKWCGDHRLANPAVIRAVRLPVQTVLPDGDQRKRLDISRREKVKYRRVQLRCGDVVLSEAENWYVPGRLTRQMNRLLDQTDSPFGKVVQSLRPYRLTFSAKMRWSPLPKGWEMGEGADSAAEAPSALGAIAIPDELFEHRAVLFDRKHRPFAEVREVYQKQVLFFRK